jgi:protein-S-isoprenylcysteine O-methyltransferase Ste14
MSSGAVLILAGAAALLAHAFVVLVEEPGLTRRFGESYARYRRWLPRPPRDAGRG